MLSREDEVLRQHILNVMCHFQTSWSTNEAMHHSLQQGIQRLEEMEKDGLVKLYANRLEVTDAGRPFIRNVCMALDQRLWDDKPETQLFSTVI
jgi:oxygen-independent coproporphyrinogen-3 oxidase